MKNKLLIILARLNIFYPNFLGLKFIKYALFLKKVRFNNFNQFPLLSKTVISSANSVPFYKGYSKFNIKNIKDFESSVPFIDKSIAMNSFNKFTLPNLLKLKHDKATTGGTSGKPLQTIMRKDRYIVEFNTFFSIWKEFGWDGHLRGVIRNKNLNKDQTFIVKPLTKEVIYDGFRTDDIYYESVYQSLKSLKIRFIQAYPSSAHQFSLFLSKHKKDVSFIRAFLCSSEPVTILQKELITGKLGIPICNVYGLSEKLIIAGPCKGNDALHIEPTYGYFELINEDGVNIEIPGEVGEMVGTSFHNDLMPLIRYKTGDFAEYVGNYCSSCNRHLTLIKNIQGRWELNKIFLSDGTYVTITALNLHSDLYEFIDGLQYIQYQKGELDIHIIKSLNYTIEQEKRFKVHFNNAFNQKCKYQIIYVDNIEKEPNGKFLTLKQLILK